MMELKLDEVEYAYLAGLTDGDGCFGVQVSNQKSGKYWNPRLSWDLTDKVAIDWITIRYGTKSWETGHKTSGVARRIAWRTQLFGQNLLDAATGMLPFLVIKRYQAELTIQAIECIGDKEFKRVICEHIQEANQRKNVTVYDGA